MFYVKWKQYSTDSTYSGEGVRLHYIVKEKDGPFDTMQDAIEHIEALGVQHSTIEKINKVEIENDTT